MANKRKLELVDLNQEFLPPPIPLDWTLCVLCQISSDQPLQTPTHVGYLSLADNLSSFAESGLLPSTVRFQQLNDGSGLVETLEKNQGKYHKVCRSRYDSFKLARLVRSSNAGPSSSDLDECPTTACRNLWSSSNTVDIRTVCIFCDSGALRDNPLVNASTLDIGSSIHA